MKIKFRSILHYVAQLGKPVLAVFGIKDKTVAAKVETVIEKADQVLPQDEVKK